VVIYRDEINFTAFRKINRGLWKILMKIRSLIGNGGRKYAIFGEISLVYTAWHCPGTVLALTVPKTHP
jgi:hypothetical protein